MREVRTMAIMAGGEMSLCFIYQLTEQNKREISLEGSGKTGVKTDGDIKIHKEKDKREIVTRGKAPINGKINITETTIQGSTFRATAQGRPCGSP